MLVLYEILSKASPELRKALIILGGLIVAGLSKGRDYICLFAGLILILNSADERVLYSIPQTYLANVCTKSGLQNILSLRALRT